MGIGAVGIAPTSNIKAKRATDLSFLKKNFMNQARYWLLTIPHAHFTPYLPTNVTWIRGQLELGAGEGEYLHWQVAVCFSNKIRLGGVRNTFGNFHAEPSRSSAANKYVFKEETRVAGTQFELGTLPVQRSSSTDWAVVRNSAIAGDYTNIPGDIYVRYYGNLRRITQDNLQPLPQTRKISCYWGPTGVGKSRRVWWEAGIEAYPKDPRSKFWDGYRGQTHVILDEFRGTIDVSHILRWFDRYPCLVEVKGSSTALRAGRMWITSNLHPTEWYPELDILTKDALLRRIEVIEEMTEMWEPPVIEEEVFEMEI